MENKFEDLNVYINEKLINQDAKLKKICSSLLEEVKIETIKEVIKLRLKSTNQKRLCSKNKLKNSIETQLNMKN